MMAPLQLGASPTPDAGSPASITDVAGTDGAFETALGALISIAPLPFPGRTPPCPATSTEGDELKLVLGEDWTPDPAVSGSEDSGAARPGVLVANNPDPTGGLSLERDLEIWLCRVGRRSVTPQQDGPVRTLFARDAEALIASRAPSDARSQAVEHLWAPRFETHAPVVGRLDFGAQPGADSMPPNGSVKPTEAASRPGPHHSAGAGADEVDAETLLRELGPVANAVEIGGFGFPTMDRVLPASTAADTGRAAPAVSPYTREIHVQEVQGADAPSTARDRRVGLLAAFQQRESHGSRDPVRQSAPSGASEALKSVFEAKPDRDQARELPVPAQRADLNATPAVGPQRDRGGRAAIVPFPPERAGLEAARTPTGPEVGPPNRRPDEPSWAEREVVPEPRGDRSPSLPAVAGSDATANGRGGTLGLDRTGGPGGMPPARTLSQETTSVAFARRPDRVTIHLRDDLGVVGRLRISFRGPSLRATIIPVEPALAARLEQELSGLHRSLEERGVADARVRIQPPGDPGAAPGGGGAESRGPERHAPGEGRRESPGHEGGQRRQGRSRERPIPEPEQPGRWA